MNNNASRPTVWTRALAASTAIIAVVTLSSCAHLNPPEPEPKPEPAVAEKKPPEPIKPPPPSSLYEWWGKDYVSHIEVSIDEQKARFYSGDEMVGWTTVASGVHKYPTPTGKFAVTEKVQDKKSNLYGKIYNKSGKLVRRNAKMGVHPVPPGGRFKGAPMPYFLRLTNDGIGLHAGPIPRPGNRASHGCIRMPRKFAPILYRHVDLGTAVTIKGNGPSYGNYLAKQRKSAPKRTAPAVAQAEPATTPASETSTANAPTSTAAQPDATQAVVDASAPAGSSAALRQDAPPGMAAQPNTMAGQASRTTPSGPAATNSIPAATAGSAIEYAPATPIAPTVSAPAAMSVAPATGMADASPYRPVSPYPYPPVSPSPFPPPAPPYRAPYPATGTSPVPAASQTPAPAIPQSMTGAPGAPAATTSQPASPVVPRQPPATAGPTAQAEG